MIKNANTDEQIEAFFGTSPLYSASVKITKQCNLCCRQCYVNTDRYKTYTDELSTGKIKSIIDQLYEMGCLKLFINGGEPLIHKDIMKIYDYATEKGFKISMSTNGYNCTREMLECIAQYKPELFQVSVDGIGDVHNSIRNSKDSFSRAVSTLKMAVEKFKDTSTNVVMASTLLIYNYRQIEELYKLAYELGVKTYAVIPVMPTGKASYEDDIPTEKKYEIFQKLAKLYKDDYTSTELSLIIPPLLIPEELRNGVYGKGYICSFPYMLGIDSNGNVAPCDGLINQKEMIIGNINECQISDLIEHPQIKKLMRIDYSSLTGVWGTQSIRSRTRILS